MTRFEKKREIQQYILDLEIPSEFYSVNEFLEAVRNKGCIATDNEIKNELCWLQDNGFKGVCFTLRKQEITLSEREKKLIALFRVLDNNSQLALAMSILDFPFCEEQQ